MNLKLFDVEHGACALLTCDNGSRIMVDCGHNASTSWKPGTYLKSQGIYTLQMLAITNYDEDHVSGIADLCDNINVQWLFRNKSVDTTILKKLKTEDGMGRGIERLAYEIDNTFTGSGQQEPIYQNVEKQIFYTNYPAFDDENNLSLVLFLRCHGIGILFPGDLEKEGWLNLLKNESFKTALRQTHVLIAPHHGRENGCCKEIKQYCNPYYVVISDKGYMYDTQKTIPFYKDMARGGPFRGETRYVLTTRCDNSITFQLSDGSWWAS
jgi:beta-lactamase superfamily II metal-dependent hydrolase